MKKNDKAEVTVESMTNLGYGVARIGGVVTFVGGAADGDRAEIKIIKSVCLWILPDGPVMFRTHGVPGILKLPIEIFMRAAAAFLSILHSIKGREKCILQ